MNSARLGFNKDENFALNSSEISNTIFIRDLNLVR
jgi:hypothetical protein